MTAQVIDGNFIARKLREKAKNQLESLKAVHGITPGLAVITVGENPASQVYVNKKHQACRDTGIYSRVIPFAGEISQGKLLECIDGLNNDPLIHGILVQLPLPGHINTELVLNRIRPDKDVDGFHPINVGNLCIGKEGLVPCTPYGIIRMLEMERIPIAGKRAVIIGRSNIVGKPMAHLLLSRHATVTVCHSRTSDLAAVTREGDILVAALGKPGFVTKDMVKPGAVVIDVGINRLGDRLVGDVDFDAVKEVASYITPVPGGVGPLTIAMLLCNTVKACRIQHNLEIDS